MTYKIPTTIYEGTKQLQKALPTPSFIKQQFLYVILPDANAGMTSEASGWVGRLPAERNPALDLSLSSDPTILTISITGTWINVSIVASPIIVTVSQLGAFGSGIIASGLIELTLSILPSDSYIHFSEPVKANWVKWSNIGSLDFTIWKDNIAGERPLDWPGWIYSIKKLGNKVIVYGEDGVSMLAPSNNAFGLLSISNIGLKGKQAVAGDDKIHYYVDAIGKLQRLSEIPQKSSIFEQSITPEELDYSEYLSVMTNPALSWDPLNRFLYICDREIGYIYSQDTNSLGSGPAAITGIGLRDNKLYIVSPSTIVNPIFEVCTDIYDMGSRKNKTIYTVELGTDVTGDLWVTLDYRKNKAEDFKTLKWHKVNPSGITNIPCYGIEFRIRVKRTTYAYFKLDYIRINGTIHNYVFQYPYVGR